MDIAPIKSNRDCRRVLKEIDGVVSARRNSPEVGLMSRLSANPEDAVEDTSVVALAARLVRKERSDGSPFKVREFISHDSRLRFGSLNYADPGVRNVDFQVRDWPDSGHTSAMSKATRMTRSRH